MTPTDIETLARQRYNAVGDTFFPQAQIMSLIYDAQMQLSIKARCIKQLTTFPSVAGTRGYSFPSRTISIKRVEYAGRRCDPIDLIDDDTITLLNSQDLAQGSPRFYATWDTTIYFRPIPDSIQTITMYVYREPDVVTAGSTMEVPTRYHLAIVDYLLFCMFAQDKDRTLSILHRELWDKALVDAERWERRREAGDQFKTVKDVDFIPTNYVRII